jgi:WD40 repeat protein
MLTITLSNNRHTHMPATTRAHIFQVSYPHRGPVRSVQWSEGGQRFVTASQPFMESPGYISVFDTPDNLDPSEFDTIATLEIPIPNKEKVGMHIEGCACVHWRLRQRAGVTPWWWWQWQWRRRRRPGFACTYQVR